MKQRKPTPPGGFFISKNTCKKSNKLFVLFKITCYLCGVNKTQYNLTLTEMNAEVFFEMVLVQMPQNALYVHIGLGSKNLETNEVVYYDSCLLRQNNTHTQERTANLLSGQLWDTAKLAEINAIFEKADLQRETAGMELLHIWVPHTYFANN